MSVGLYGDGVSESQENINVTQYGWTNEDVAGITLIQDYLNQIQTLFEQVVILEASAQEMMLELDQIKQMTLEVRVMYADFIAKYPKIQEALDQMDATLVIMTNMAQQVTNDKDHVDLVKSQIDTIKISIDSSVAIVNQAVIDVTTMRNETNAYYQATKDIAEELAKGQVYRGTWNPNSGAWPNPNGTNSVWDVVLNEGQIEVIWNNIKWVWGDRLLYLKDTSTYQQIESGIGVLSVNGKAGFVTLSNEDVGAAPAGFGIGEVEAFTVTDMDTNPTTWNGGKMGTIRGSSTTLNLPDGQTGTGFMYRYQNLATSPVYVEYFSNDNKTYTRRWSGGAWSSWKLMYDSTNKPDTGGMATGVGTSPNLLTTTGNVRDFNLAKTTGVYTVEGSWANGVDNQGTASSHTGLMEVKQRTFDNMTIQKFTYTQTISGIPEPREVTRAWTNATDGWSPWFTSGVWDSVNTYRSGIIRHNSLTADDGNYPYTALTKEKYRDTLAVGVSYTVGELSFRAGSANRYDPHSGDSLARVVGNVQNTAVAGEYEGGLYLSSRSRKTDGSTVDSVILHMNKNIGSEFTHGGKKFTINTGNAIGENFYQNAAQDPVNNALTRVDYVKSLVAGALPSITPLKDTDDLDNMKTSGFYSQPANAKATVANHYPVQKAGTLMVTVAAGPTQRYFVYNSSEVWSRGQYNAGAWTNWERDYNTAFKPTAADVGTMTTTEINSALSGKLNISGGTLTGSLIVANMKSAIKVNDQRSISFQDQSNVMYHTFAQGNSLVWNQGLNGENNVMQLNSDGTLSTQGSVYSKVGLIARNRASTNWLALETPEGGAPYISAQAHGEASASKVVEFGVNEILSYKRLATNDIRVGSSGGLKFSPTTTLDGITWGVGVEPSTGALGINKYINGVWNSQPFWVKSDGVVNMNSLVVNGGSESQYHQVRNLGNPSLELHEPGKFAVMVYKPQGTSTIRFCQSNGAGGEAKGYGGSDSDGFFTAAGRFRANYVAANRAWTGVGQTPLYAEGISVGNGAFRSIVGGYTSIPSQWGLEATYGMFCSNNPDFTSHALSMTDGAGYTKYWILRNDSTLIAPTGWSMDGNGTLHGTVFGSYDTMINWCTASFAAKSDANLKTNITKSNKSALSEVSKIQFKSYDWKDTEKGHVDIGVIAQDIEEINPQYTSQVSTFDKDGKPVNPVKTLDMVNLLSLSLKANQELLERVEKLEAIISNYENQPKV
ncbi:tail protein [Aeromonas phage 4_4572]|uniref:Hinge connector of long tail fiber distal connector n=1 Tax=Aeromonas phage 4_4572 TaxID=2588517 RepID=A0A5B9N9C2_9CAUD|nr:tail protein [Aeromonas phage 4_4572]QEG09072.1 hinge connector of long tail fiber distal connector [Aeromonas phage 4_4572]